MKIVYRKFLKNIAESVHAASIDFINSYPVFAWFGGHREGSPDTSIFIQNLHNQDDIITLGSRDNIARWNPVLVNICNSLYLFEKAGIFCDRWQTFFHNLSAWSYGITEKEIIHDRQTLASGLYGPVKSRPVLLDDVFLCGSSVETIYDWTSYIEEYKMPTSIISDINSLFIKRSKPLYLKDKKYYIDNRTGISGRTLGLIQPSLVNYHGLHAFFRSSRGLEKIYYSYRNEDQEWSLPVPTSLANPNSAIDSAVVDEKLFLIYNPNSVYRYPLVLSEIEIKNCDIHVKNTLPIRIEMDKDNPYCFSEEFSYPYMIEHDNLLHIVYTYCRTLIEYVIVDPRA